MVGIEQTTYGLPARHSHLPGLNRKPIAYEAIALPIELRWLWQAGDTVLYQLSYFGTKGPAGI